MSIAILREYRTIDKSTWGAGPWQREPDKVQWRDAATGLPCLVVRGPSGALCGYVGVAEGHPCFGRDEGDVDLPEGVHGGLTYADRCQAGPEETMICHIPEPGQPDHVWWLGFDCAHRGDYCPAHRGDLGAARADPRDAFEDRRMPYKTYRDLAFVQGQCADLARQLAAVAG